VQLQVEEHRRVRQDAFDRRRTGRREQLEADLGDTEPGPQVTGQAQGDFRQDLDARFASFVFYGALEEMLTGWVLGQLPDSDDAIALAERTIVETLCDGMLVAQTSDRVSSR